MPNVWFYRQSEDELEVGPLQPRELLQHVREGHVEQDTEVRKDDSAWFPAAEVGGLFDAAARPPEDPYCPNCAHPVSGAGVECGNCGFMVRNPLMRPRKIDPIAEARAAKRGGNPLTDWLKKKGIKD